MSQVVTEILIIFFLILLNGLFAMSEIAVVSARKVRLQQAAEAGNKGAQVALELASEPTRFLSTVQIGITLIGILAGAFGGAYLAEELALVLSQFSWLEPYSSSLGVILVVLVITYFSLVLGELTPKRLALSNAERIAGIIAPPMRFLARVTSPIVRFISASTDLMLRLLGVQDSAEQSVTEEDIKIMIGQGTEVGVFEPIEEQMVGQVFRLSDRTVSALITPRREIVWLDIDDSPAEIRNTILENGYSRYPVARGSLDDVAGVVLTKDLLTQSWLGQELDLPAVLQPVMFVPEGLPAFDMLERFRSMRSQIALVIDEYGVLQGLVTVNDILEAIVGDLPEADDVFDPEVVRREDGSWLLDGMLPVDEFMELFGIREMPADTEGYYQTVGGFVMTMLGRIPTVGDHFDWQTLHIEVVDMDERRVDKVLVMPAAAGADAPQE